MQLNTLAFFIGKFAFEIIYCAVLLYERYNRVLYAYLAIKAAKPIALFRYSNTNSFGDVSCIFGVVTVA